MFAVGGQVPIITNADMYDVTNADLYDAASIKYGVSNRLEPLHLIQRLQYSRVFQIHQSEGRDVNRVVLEILQVERLYVLQNQSACSKAHSVLCLTLLQLSRRDHNITLRTVHTLRKIYVFHPGIKCTDFDEIWF